MNFLRKLGLGIAVFFYMPLLLLLPTLVSLNATITQPKFIKETLVKAQVYEGISSFIVEQASKNPETAGNTVVIASLQQATAAPELQKMIEPVIDGVYAYLENPDSEFSAQINLQPIKDNFMRVMEQNLKTKLSSLPNCTSRAQVTTDPFSMTCLPPGTNVDQILKQTKAELEQNGELLGEEQTIELSENGQQIMAESEANAPVNPADKAVMDTPKFDTSQLKFYARVYRWIKVGLPVVAVLTALATLAILLLSKPRYKGIRRTGVFLLISGIVLLITSVGTGLGVRALLPVPSTGGSLSAAGTKAADIIIKKVVFINNRFTIAYVVLGLICIITGVIIGKKYKGKHPDESIEKENMLPESGLGEDAKRSAKPTEKVAEKDLKDSLAEEKPVFKRDEEPQKPTKTKINVE